MNETISNQQFIFLPGRSTTLQMISALDDWTAVLDKGNEVDVIHIALQKGFDSVIHRRLLNIISRYGVRGKTLVWITASCSKGNSDY